MMKRLKSTYSKTDRQFIDLKNSLIKEILEYLEFYQIISEIFIINKTFFSITKSLDFTKSLKSYLFQITLNNSKEALIDLQNEHQENINILNSLFKKSTNENELIKFFSKYHMKYFENFDFTVNEFNLNDYQKLNDFKLFSSFLTNTLNLTVLNLEGNSLGLLNTQNFLNFCDGIINNKTIKKLNLSQNYLGVYQKNFEIFCKSMSLNQKLEILNLSDNKLSKNLKNFDNLMLIYENNKKIKKIILDLNGFDSIYTCFYKLKEYNSLKI